MSHPTTSDTYLWLTVIIGLYTAYCIIPPTLAHVRHLVEVHDDKPDDSRKRLQSDAEDALKPETLRILASAPSYDLRSSAIKIIANRVLKSDAKKQLLLDLSSPKARKREKAINALWLLLFHDSGIQGSRSRQTQEFTDIISLRAIVDALIVVLPLHERFADDEVPKSPLKPKTRPDHERSLLYVLNELLMYSPAPALNAGIINKWLCNYPFPCADERWTHLGFKKSDVTDLFRSDSWSHDDPLMAGVIKHLSQDPRGLKQLREAGLFVSKYKESLCATSSRRERDRSPWNEAFEDDEDVEMEGGTDTAGPRPGSSWAREAPERSAEEGELRRRRNRETIVVAEPGEMLTQDNILMRENSRIGLTSAAAVTAAEMAEFEGSVRRRLNIATGVVENVGADLQLDPSMST